MMVKIDKSSWPEGPWHDEIDYKETTIHDLRCVFERNKDSGCWHVTIYFPEEEGNKFLARCMTKHAVEHGRRDDEIYTLSEVIRVHGGIKKLWRTNNQVIIGFAANYDADIRPANLKELTPAFTEYLQDLINTFYAYNPKNFYASSPILSYKTLEFMEEECRRFLHEYSERDNNDK